MPDLISRQEALARGLKRYFTGVPCKRGHVAERYSSSPGCIKCISEDTARRAPAYRERQLMLARNRRAKNWESHRKYERDWVAKNPEKMKEYRRRQRAKLYQDPLRYEKAKANSRRRYAENREKRIKQALDWRTRNMERYRATRQEYNRCRREVAAQIAAERRRVFQADHPELASRIVSKQEALERGLKRYFTGKPCKNGHVAERVLLGGCVMCIRENGRLGYYRNLGKNKLRGSNYAGRKECARRYFERNREKIMRHDRESHRRGAYAGKVALKLLDQLGLTLDLPKGSTWYEKRRIALKILKNIGMEVLI